jgi:hypothetical protein
MAEHRLYRRQIDARIEQVACKRAPTVMRRKGCDAGALGEVAEAVVDRLVGEPPSRPAWTATARGGRRGSGQIAGAGWLA